MPVTIRHNRRKLSVPQLAEQMGVSDKKVIGWIRAGELRAVNLASTTTGRPRYAIDLADIAAFERSRQIVPDAEPASTQQLRRRARSDVKRYF